MKLNLTDKEFDIVLEALTTYSDECAKGGYAYTSDEIDQLSEKIENHEG